MVEVGNMDIDNIFLVKLKKFIEEECMAGLCFVEHGGAFTHKYFQRNLKGNFSSLIVLKKKIKVCLRWDESPCTSHVVSCKRLRDEGLQTFKRWLGIV
jgi:hypothetical protein